MDTITIQRLEQKAKDIRIKTIEMIGYLGVGHIGGSMSIIEILAALYYHFMRIDPKKPKMADRDKLVLSKGHAGPALYATLADIGFFPEQWLHTLNHGGTKLPSHCDMNKTPGIDMTTGSLGQGISAAAGLALAGKIDKSTRNIYCIIGDGESNEGQVWEAALAAPQFRLNNLIAFTDYNKMQIDGYTKDLIDLGELEKKWESFGWFTQRIDGHDMHAILQAVEKAKAEQNAPSMIVCDTVKGKGCSIAEGVLSNHNMVFDYEQAQEAIKKVN